MIESINNSLDKGGKAGALLTDLSKAFDCILHDLLIAKLHAYGFSIESLRLINNYLSNRKQRTKIDSQFSSWEDIIFGVPQGSILGPLFYNINSNDIFFFADQSEIANYADDNTPYACAGSIEEVIKKLETDANLLMTWFYENGLKLNAEKCKFLLFSKEPSETAMRVGDALIKNSDSEKLLGIDIDSKLTFKGHVNKLCKKANQKLHALARVSNYMNEAKLRTIMKAFVTSQFGYCPLVWMFHDRKNNNRINKIQERALKLIYKEDASSFTDLLKRDSSVTIHERNLQVLATEIYKVENNIGPVMMNAILAKREIPYNLRAARRYKTNNVKSVRYGTETISYRSAKIREFVPDHIMHSASLNEFKKKIKTWKPDACDCRLCKIYIAKIGFL